MAVILVVEDKEQVRRLLVVILTPEHQVIQAAEAAQAIEMARQHRPQLILLDLHLQGERDGLQVCRTLRRDPDPALARLPIVMLTGETGADDIQAALEAGANSYVSKPYSPNALLTLVDTLLARG